MAFTDLHTIAEEFEALSGYLPREALHLGGGMQILHRYTFGTPRPVLAPEERLSRRRASKKRYGASPRGRAGQARYRKTPQRRACVQAYVAKTIATGKNAAAQRSWKAAKKAAGYMRVRFEGVERWVKVLPGGEKNTRAMLLSQRAPDTAKRRRRNRERMRAVRARKK